MHWFKSRLWKHLFLRQTSNLQQILIFWVEVTFYIYIYMMTHYSGLEIFLLYSFSFSVMHFEHFTCFLLVSFILCPLISFLLVSPCFISVLPPVREKFLTEIQSPRYARLRDWHHERSARALNIKSWAARMEPPDAEPARECRTSTADEVHMQSPLSNGSSQNSPFTNSWGGKKEVLGKQRKINQKRSIA